MTTGTGIAVAGGLGLVGNLGSGMMQSSAISGASNAANALQWNMYEQNRADLAPWRAAGTTAIDYLGGAVMPGGAYNQFTTADFLQDPGYAWRMSEGDKSLAAAGAATGAYGSGNMAVAAENFGQNLASNEYQNAYNRWQDSYNRIAGVSGIGQTAAQGTVNAGTNAANTMSQNTMTAGIGSANAWGNAFGGMNSTVQSGIGSYMNYMNNQQLMQMLGGGGGGSGGGWGGYYGGMPASMYTGSIPSSVINPLSDFNAGGVN